MSPPDSASPLAVLGASPAFAEPLHVGRPNVANRAGFNRRVEEMLDRNWLTNSGPLVREFEAKIAKHAGVEHCIAVCNATIGLELAIRACDLRGEVIVPSYTFVATAHALQWQEITPVFADIDESRHTLDPQLVERHITPRTTGIIATHLWGRPCDIAGLEAIARARNLKLIFDAAHAFGSSHQGRALGGFGNAEVFSFHATKFLNAFEGGAITTNDGELAAKIRLMKNFGFSGYDNVIYVGTNGKMPEVCAAMGLSNLERMDDIIATNRENFETYVEGMGQIPGLRVIAAPAEERWNYQYIVVEVSPEECGLTRDELVEVLRAENILARKYFWPGCHRMEPYASYYPHAGLLLPKTEAVAARVLVLPTGLALSPQEIRTVVGILKTAIARSDAVRSALRSSR